MSTPSTAAQPSRSDDGALVLGPARGVVAWLAFSASVHALVVGLSALGAHPLASAPFAIAILVGSLGLALGFARRVAPHSPERPREATRGAPRVASLVLGAAAALTLALGIALALLLPVIAYDALAYRLPAIAQWLAAGRVAWVATDDQVRNGYPLGQEAVSAVVAAATHSLRGASATSFVYLVSGALAIAWLAEACGIRRELARAAAALFVLVPMVILNAPSGYVDAAFAAATITLLCSATLYARAAAPDRWLAATTGLAAANVLALKGTGIVFVTFISAALVAAALLRKRWSRRELGPAALALACALPGGFWLLRNVAHTGNPLWPITIALHGHTLFPGVGSVETVLDTLHNTPKELAALPGPLQVLFTWFELHGPAIDFDDRFAGLGYAWPLFALPAVATLAFGLARRRAELREFSGIGFLLLLTLGCFCLQPMRWWPRYTLFVWGAGAIAIAAQAERWARAGRQRTLALYLTALAVVCIGEAGFAVPHAKDIGRALARVRNDARPLAALTDVRYAPNARAWVAPKFWELELEHGSAVCRGWWKPETDNPNLDGVLAQLDPRLPVYAIDDDAQNWPHVRAQWRRLGCRELLLFPRSPVLGSADGDPEVSVERAVAFDSSFIVRPRTAVNRIRAQDASP